MNKPNLYNYITRYRQDTELLKKHPDKKDLLEKRIKQHEKEIIRLVTSDSFYNNIEKMEGK